MDLNRCDRKAKLRVLDQANLSLHRSCQGSTIFIKEKYSSSIKSEGAKKKTSRALLTQFKALALLSDSNANRAPYATPEY